MNLECVICLEKLNAAEDLSVLRCGHLFHTGCITNWINAKSNCPKCRNRTALVSMIKLFVETEQAVSDPSQRRSLVPDLQAQIAALSELLDDQSKLISDLESEKASIQKEADLRAAIDKRNFTKTVKDLNDCVAKLQTENATYGSLRKLLSDKEVEWKEELKKYGGDDNGPVRSLVVVLTTTKAELKQSLETRKDLVRRNAKDLNLLSREKGELRVELAKRNAENDDLRKALSKKERELEELREKCEALQAVASASSSSQSENRPPRRARSRPASAKTNDTIVLSSDDEDGACGYHVPQPLVTARALPRGRVGYNGIGGRDPLENPLPNRDGRQLAKKPRVAANRAQSKPRQHVLNSLDNFSRGSGTDSLL